jgi:hypothetical protein
LPRRVFHRPSSGIPSGGRALRRRAAFGHGGVGPGHRQWLRRVFLVAGGFMVGTGLLTTFIAGSPQLWRPQSAGWALAFAGGPVVLMSAVNFDLDSDFRWLLVLPVLLWASAVGCRAAGR